MRKLWAVAISLAFAVAIVSPVFRSPPRDSYPLSNYPMFSYRIEPANDISAVIGRDRSGARVLLSPQLIADSDEVMIALQTVNDAIGSGDEAAAGLCSTVANRVAAGGNGEVVAVEVVTERYDTIAWFSGDKEPLSVRIYAACEVDA